MSNQIADDYMPNIYNLQGLDDDDEDSGMNVYQRYGYLQRYRNYGISNGPRTYRLCSKHPSLFTHQNPVVFPKSVNINFISDVNRNGTGFKLQYNVGN